VGGFDHVPWELVAQVDVLGSGLDHLIGEAGGPFPQGLELGGR
jgi:hypothetical protein